MSKLINTFQVRFDDETKAEIAALKGKLDAVAHRLNVGHAMPTGGLLAVMAGEAANDAPQPELKTLGQWVFEGHDERLVTAFINANGVCRLTNVPIGHLVVDDKHWRMDSDKIKDNPNYFWVDLGGDFDNSDWRVSATRRQLFNDVDYLSTSLDECVPHIDDVLAYPNWLSESVPQITQADMQLIFIKNLSEVLIQRTHSMDRFSEDDYAIGGDKLMAWDIVFNDLGNEFGIVTGFNKYHQMMVSFFKQCANGQTMTGSLNFHLTTMIGKNLRTITESELPAFRAALEACYA